MQALWRISGHSDLQGLGGERSNGRWHSLARGKRIVYLSEHPAVALIEALVNLKGKVELFPTRYQLMKVNAAASVSIETLAPRVLSVDWRENIAETRAAGDSWLARKQLALLVVPSAPSPESLNYLLNPLHPDATCLVVEWCKWVDYDKRFFRI